MSIVLKRRLERIEAKLQVVNASTPLSDNDIATLGFNPDDAPSLQEFQQYCLNAMNNTSATIYDDVDYQQSYDAPEALPEIESIVEPEELPKSTATTKVVPMQSVSDNVRWFAGAGEPRDVSHYEDY